MEKRVFFKKFEDLLKEHPNIEVKQTISNILNEILPLYGFEIHDKVIAVKNPAMAVLQGKGKYFSGKFKDNEGLFFVFVGISVESYSSNLQVIFNPQVSLF